MLSRMHRPGQRKSLSVLKTSSIAEKRDELKALNAEIAERYRYYTHQEAQIKELVESGNTQLMGLHHDIIMATQRLREIKTDIRTAAQDKVLLNEDLEQIRGEIQITIRRTTFIGFAPSFG